MRRGRGKGRRLTVVRSHEDPGSGAEERLPAYKRRGRPQRPLKDDIDEEDIQKIEEEGDDVKLPLSGKEVEVPRLVENVKKRKRHSRAKENVDSVMEEDDGGVKSGIEESNKQNGFQQNGSRRKSKPRRAAEVGVECK